MVLGFVSLLCGLLDWLSLLAWCFGGNRCRKTGRLRGSRCFDGINREDRKSPNMKLAKIVFLDFHSLSTRIQRSGSSSPYSPNPESLLEVKLE